MSGWVAKPRSLPAVFAALVFLAMLSGGCGGSFTSDDAVGFTLRYVDLPGKGGLWKQGDQTLHFWAKAKHESRSDEAVYDAFALFIERSYNSIMSCPHPPRFVRVSVLAPKDDLWVFEAPFSVIKDYFRSATPADAFWDGIRVTTEKSSGWPPPTPGLTNGTFTLGLVNDGLASIDGAESLESSHAEWDGKRHWFMVDVVYGTKADERSIRDVDARVGGIIDKACSKTGLSYSGVRFDNSLPGNKWRPVSYTRSALRSVVGDPRSDSDR